MARASSLFSPSFLGINLLFALVTGIAALFFAFSGYLAQLGVAPATAGFIISADALAALIVQPLIAPLVHPASARRWLGAGSLVLAAALFMTGRVASAPLLVAARLAQGAGFICVLTALITLVVRLIPPEMSGRAFGWVSLVRLIPYAVIPPLFDIMALSPSSFPRVLNLAALAALVPLMTLLLPKPEPTDRGEDSRSPGMAGMRESLRSTPVLLLLVSTLLFFSSYAAVFFYLKQFAADQGIANASLFFTIATLVMILVRLAGGWLFDRYAKVLLCSLGLAAAALSYFLLSLTAAAGPFFALAALCGLGWGIALPLQAAVMFDLSPPATRGLNQNLLIVMMQGGFFLGPFLGGQIIARGGFTPLFAVLGSLTLAALFTMAAAGRRAGQSPAKTE